MKDSCPLPSGRDHPVETPKLEEFVDELRVQWKLLWRNRIDDKIRAEGIANQDYSKLFVDKGTVIIATRDYKPPDFIDILQQHLLSDTEKLVPPNPTVGGWGKFIRSAVNKQKRFSRRGRPQPTEPHHKKRQQPKNGGRGWLHFRMK